MRDTADHAVRPGRRAHGTGADIACAVVRLQCSTRAQAAMEIFGLALADGLGNLGRTGYAAALE
jgi:hypothetical protein